MPLNFSYNDIHKTVADSAQIILASDFQPDYLLAIGGGGFIPARMLRTFINRPIISVSITRYDNEKGLGEASSELTTLQWLDKQQDLTNKNILVVDEIDDERTTLDYCLNRLIQDFPHTNFASFVVHNKEKDKKGTLPEKLRHFFVGKTIPDEWVNYAWDTENIESL
ncbi:Xanthine phosphoribosyltransferase [invertebrate metagenome]|uniref:Xanthine phosphoribosyltransferase n=1 Tax=invertebrate metagenome TaxID=1711999 RepID=A0A2H9TAD8_9ZZZZ